MSDMREGKSELAWDEILYVEHTQAYVSCHQINVELFSCSKRLGRRRFYIEVVSVLYSSKSFTYVKSMRSSLLHLFFCIYTRCLEIHIVCQYHPMSLFGFSVCCLSMCLCKLDFMNGTYLSLELNFTMWQYLKVFFPPEDFQLTILN